MATITITTESRLENIDLLSAAIRGLCESAALPAADIDRIELCVVEALNNVVLHAYCNQPSHQLAVNWQLAADRLQIDISDQGNPIATPPPQDLPAADAEGGRGWFIMKACMDSLHYCSAAGTNTLTLVKRLGSRTQDG